MTAQKLRFKEFSEDYNVSTFQEAAIQIIDGDRGNNYPKSDDFYDNEYCLFLNAGNVTKSGFKFENTQFINKEKDALLRKGKLQKNDLVITTRGTVGNIAYFDESIPFENIRINSGMVIARSEIDVEPIYLNQFLKSDLFEKWLEKNVFGSAQPQLTVKLLNSISISYPSKAEQTKIATFLSAVDEKISQLTQKHALLSQYKQGMMQKLFSQQIRFKADDGGEFAKWEDSKLGELTTLITKGTTPSSLGEKYEESGINFIKIESLSSNGKFLLDKFAYIDENTHNKLARSKLEHDDILFSIAGALGRVAIISRDYLPANTNQALAIIRLKDKKITRYIYYFLNSDYVKKIIDAESVQLAQANFSLGQLANLDVLVPCLEEQTKIANFLSAIDQKIEVVAQQIEQAKTWKTGLLQQMFV